MVISSAGGTHQFGVNSNLAWSASSDQSWCSILSTSGNGAGNVSFNVEANTATNERTAIITVVAGSQSQKVTITQQGMSFTLSVSSNVFIISSDADSHEFTISSNTAWNISSNQNWCTVSTVSGSGNQKITFVVSENTGTRDRDATISVVAGSLVQEISLVQRFKSLTLSVSSNSFSVGSESNRYNFNVMSNTSWTVSSNQPWCSVTQSSGTGNATLSFDVSANTLTTDRSAIITIRVNDNLMQTVNIQQQGVDQSLLVSSNNFTIASTAGSNTFTITSNLNWSVSSNQSWCTVSPASGSNNGNVTFTLSANPTTSPRVAIITVSAGSLVQQIAITQDSAFIPELSVSAEMISMATTAGSGTVEITSNQNWTVTSNQSWCTVSPTSGSNNGTINFDLTANPSTSIRTATITVTAGSLTKQVTIEQQGTDKTLIVSSNSFNMAASAGSNSFTVTSNQSWTVSSNQTWCTVNPTSGTNNGSVTFTLAENTTTSLRIAVISVSGGGITQQITVTQQATIIPVLSVSSETISVAVAAGSGTVEVTSNQNWTVASNQTWCTVSPQSGANDGTINFSYSANTSTSIRTAILTLTAGSLTKQVTIEQQGTDNTLLVSSNSFDMSASAGNNSFTITSNQSWTVASNQTWCTVSPVSGSNNGAVSFTVAENTETSSRIAIITVTAGTLSQQVTVTQQAAAPFLNVSSEKYTLAATAGNGTVNITSNQNWTVESNQSWCTVTPSSGSNNGTINFTITANETTSERTALITITTGSLTKQVTIEQQAADKTLLVSSNTFTMPASAGNNNFTITSNQNWSVASNQNWCTVSPTSGSNNGAVTFTLLANTTTSSRVAVITVTAGTLTQPITVNQQEAAGTLDVNPTSTSFSHLAESQSFDVTSNQNWTVSSNQTWCSVSPTSGINNGSVTVSVQENTSDVERTSTITFTAGSLQKQATVTQSGASNSITLNGIKMIYVKGGTFLMGSPASDPESSSSERPQHDVTLSDFYLSETEITNEQYCQFLNENGINSNGQGNVLGYNRVLVYAHVSGVQYSDRQWRPANGRDNHPIVNVTWHGAIAFCEWIGGRLPTEAEWEYAARGGNKSQGFKYSGSNDSNDVAWTSENSYENYIYSTYPVGTKLPNELGLYDMSGNVFEWCNDWYGSYSSNAQTNPQGPSTSTYGYGKMLRGGCFLNNSSYARVSFRFTSSNVTSVHVSWGFRIAYSSK